MSDKTRAKGDAHAGSDASGVRVTQVFADLKETLTETDPTVLAKTPPSDIPIDVLATKVQVEKEDSPEVYHDNICDPIDIHLLPGNDSTSHNANKESLQATATYTGMPEVDILREKKDENTASGLSEKFILEGHSYL